MNASITNSKKKYFLKWFTRNYELKRRESLWILDYLYNHDIMLEKTHFVERVDQTPRGIYMTVKGNQKPSFRFYKNGHMFKDAMQAFHEIRLNWSSHLYIEIDFEDAWQSPEYLAILEDNPNARWNDTVPEELFVVVNEALDYETLLYARQQILEKIDTTLSNGREDKFANLTEDLKKVNHQIDRTILK
jgi:uncharacterized protein YpiB (UPF0302 family)